MLTNLQLRWGMALVVTAMAGVVVSQWALAGPTSPELRRPSGLVAPTPIVENRLPASVPPSAPTARRREAVLTMPQGTYVKSFEVEPFCRGRIVWNYEDDRVTGTIEIESEMAGSSAELAIDSEIALSRSGVVFGVVTGVRLTELKVNAMMLAALAEKFPLKISPKIDPFVEPLVNDVLIDTPFSYQCRIAGDRMTISQMRLLASGPATKYAMMAAPQFAGIAQAPAVALEGTYTRVTDKASLPAERKVRGQAATRDAVPRVPCN